MLPAIKPRTDDDVTHRDFVPSCGIGHARLPARAERHVDVEGANLHGRPGGGIETQPALQPLPTLEGGVMFAWRVGEQRYMARGDVEMSG
jgi:hypothetical protein